ALPPAKVTRAEALHLLAVSTGNSRSETGSSRTHLKNGGAAPRAARRPSGKARRPSIPGVCEEGATPPDGMHRRQNADHIDEMGSTIMEIFSHRADPARHPQRVHRRHERRRAQHPHSDELAE